jgi:dolichol-phosphate mannosyltransferase
MIYFLIPVFNEALNLEILSKRTTGALPGYDKFYLFVDDHSTDDSVNLIGESFKDHPHSVILKDKNEGPGDSFNRGFEWILQHSRGDSDIVVTMEGDNTSDINILKDMVTISALGYELVLASVYAQSGGFKKTTFVRKLMSLVANLIFRQIFGVKVLTLSSFYRVYHISLIRKIKDHFPVIIEKKGFICMLEILLKAIRLEAKIIEVPMQLNSDLRKGKSKMKLFRTTYSYLAFVLQTSFSKQYKAGHSRH